MTTTASKHCENREIPFVSLKEQAYPRMRWACLARPYPVANIGFRLALFHKLSQLITHSKSFSHVAPVECREQDTEPPESKQQKENMTQLI